MEDQKAARMEDRLGVQMVVLKEDRLGAQMVDRLVVLMVDQKEGRLEAQMEGLKESPLLVLILLLLPQNL